jgi:hypothetical protein
MLLLLLLLMMMMMLILLPLLLSAGVTLKQLLQLVLHALPQLG